MWGPIAITVLLAPCYRAAAADSTAAQRSRQCVEAGADGRGFPLSFGPGRELWHDTWTWGVDYRGFRANDPTGDLAGAGCTPLGRAIAASMDLPPVTPRGVALHDIDPQQGPGYSLEWLRFDAFQLGDRVVRFDGHRWTWRDRDLHLVHWKAGYDEAFGPENPLISRVLASTWFPPGGLAAPPRRSGGACSAFLWWHEAGDDDIIGVDPEGNEIMRSSREPLSIHSELEGVEFATGYRLRGPGRAGDDWRWGAAGRSYRVHDPTGGLATGPCPALAQLVAESYGIPDVPAEVDPHDLTAIDERPFELHWLREDVALVTGPSGVNRAVRWDGVGTWRWLDANWHETRWRASWEEAIEQRGLFPEFVARTYVDATAWAH